MKCLFGSISLLLLLLLLCLLSTQQIAGTIDQTSVHLNAAISAQQAGLEDAAQDQIRAAEHIWRSKEAFFGTVLQHDEIDEVIIEFARLRSYAETEDQDDFLSNCNALLARLQHIQEMEYPLLQNIL